MDIEEEVAIVSLPYKVLVGMSRSMFLGQFNREYSLENVVKGRGNSLYLFYFLFCNNAQKNSLCSYHSSSLISLILFIV